MKVLLTNPPWVDEERIGFRSNVRWPFTISKADFKRGGSAAYHFPIYQAYAIAVLEEAGFEAAAIDCAVSGIGLDKFTAQVAAEAPDLVVVEVSTPSIHTDLRTIERLKSELGKPVALIGTHSTVYHREMLEAHESIDFVLRGEYEITLCELARTVEYGGDVSALAGVTFRKHRHVVANADRRYLQKLDTLPFPARDHFEWRKYHEPTYHRLPWITMISSRGCPFKCTFCSWPQVMYGHDYRVRSPQNVVDEMEYCKEKYKPGEVFFDDDTFTIGRKRVEAICDEMLARRLDMVWTCMGRVDNVDRALLDRMYGAGCRKIKFGVETGSPAIIENIRKKIDLGRVREVFAEAKEAGLEVHGTFMIGLPGETRDTVRETIELACSLDQDSIQFSIATPFPGTEFFAQCRQNNWLVTTDWSNYDGNFGSVVSYPGLSKSEIEELLYFATMEFERRKHREKHVGRFVTEAKRGGMRGALVKTSEYLRVRGGRALHRLGRAGRVAGGVRLGTGWYEYDSERGGIPMSSTATVLLPDTLTREAQLVLEAKSAVADRPQTVEVFAGGGSLGKAELSQKWQTVSFPVRTDLGSEITLHAAETIPYRAGKWRFHYSIIVKEIGLVS